MRSNVNLSRIARVAGCCGVPKVVCASPAKFDPKIARDAIDTVELDARRSLPPVLEELRAAGYAIVEKNGCYRRILA